MDTGAQDTGGHPTGTTPVLAGVIPFPAVPLPRVVDLGDLQRRVLEAVAARWSSVSGRRHDAGPGAAEGLAVLLASLPPGVDAGTDDVAPTVGRGRRARRGRVRSCTDDVRRGDGPNTERATLRRVVAVTGRLAEAGHRAAMTMSAAGREDEAEVADEVSTCAHALRMLAEIELSTIPGP